MYQFTATIQRGEMMIEDKGAQILDWLGGWFTWLGEEGVDLFRDAVDWVQDLGVYGYVLGGVVVLVLMWYAGRRA